MQPAKTRRLRPLVHCLPALAVVLVAPAALPHFAIIGSEQSAFTTGRHDLVLAERKRGDVAERSDRTATIGCTVRLCAILNDFQSALTRKREDWVHVGRPPREVHNDDRLRARGESGGYGVGSQVPAVAIHVGAHRLRAPHHNTTRRRNEGAARHDHFVAWTDIETIQRKLERDRTVSQRDAVLASRELGELALERSSFIARPVVDLAGTQDLRDRLDFIRRERRPW